MCPSARVATKLLTKHDGNNISKNYTFRINVVSMKINRQSQIQFRGEDLWPDRCIKYTLRMSNTLQPIAEFCCLIGLVFETVQFQIPKKSDSLEVGASIPDN